MRASRGLTKVFSAVVLGAAALGMVACSGESVSKEATNNPNITYEVLFERKGCEVGRFNDGSARTVYITLCPQTGTSTASYDESCGKNCTNSIMNTQSTAPTVAPVQAPVRAPGGPQ